MPKRLGKESKAYIAGWGVGGDSNMSTRNEQSHAERWTKAQLSGVAQVHFPGGEGALERALREFAEHHEAIWRATAAGAFRPTTPMYALALRWQLAERGPTCPYCHARIEVPVGPSHPIRPEAAIALGPRVHPRQGGLNVPQNLVLGHAGCVPKL